MKIFKKIAAVGLAASLLATAALSANAFFEEEYPVVKGNKYLISELMYSEGEIYSETNYTVDEQYRVIDVKTFEYDEGVKATDNYSSEYILNDDGTVKEKKAYETRSGVRNEITSVVYEYNAAGLVTSETETTFDYDPSYVESVVEYAYDADNNLISRKVTRYDSQGVVTRVSEKTYAYSNGNIIEKVDYRNSDPEDKETYTYYENGKLKSEIDWSYVSGTGWVENYKYEYTYSADGKTRTEMEYDYDDVDGYLLTDKRICIYDDNGNLLSEEHWDTYDEGATYKECCKDVYTYDEFGNVLTVAYCNWNSSDGVYDESEKFVYIYGTYEVPVQATSPKTSDVTPVAVALTGVIALGALVISKKK